MPHLEHLAKIPNKTPLVNVQELSHDCLRLEAHHYVEGLQRLSPTLEKPMPSTRPKSEPLPLVPVKEYSRASVQRLFPLASQAVKDQLCLAIAARRQIVTLRQSAEQLSRYSKSLSVRINHLNPLTFGTDRYRNPPLWSCQS